ncbi:hypothetical protein Tco_0997625 [Tanacetum coccineum]
MVQKPRSKRTRFGGDGVAVEFDGGGCGEVVTSAVVIAWRRWTVVGGYRVRMMCVSEMESDEMVRSGGVDGGDRLWLWHAAVDGRIRPEKGGGAPKSIREGGWVYMC